MSASKRNMPQIIRPVDNEIKPSPRGFMGLYFHNWVMTWMWGREKICLFGVAGGRVSYEPEYRFLYSVRLFFGLVKFEILWKTK